MKQEFIINKKSSSVAILFAGWGMDTTPFHSGTNFPCDFLIVYDYNDLSFDTSILASYSNIYIFAWSFGVFVATDFIIKNPTLPIGFKMAINGTMFPIDDSKGIPKAIFDGTLNSLCEASLNKFFRRMCANSAHFQEFISNKPIRDIESLRTELIAINEFSAADISAEKPLWDKVIIGKNDRIFPFQNQINGWNNNSKSIIETENSHLPDDFLKIIADNIINKHLLKRRFSKSLVAYNTQATCQQKITQRLHSLWKSVDYRVNSSILEVGCGTGFLTHLYATEICPSCLVLNDLCNIPEEFIEINIPYSFIQGDAELQTFNGCGNFDYIVSSSAIQWFENLPKFIAKTANILNDGGYIVFSTFGNQNMNELSSLTGVSLNYLDIEGLKTILSPYFDIAIIEEDNYVLYFDTPLDVLRHIKATGVNSIGNDSKWTKSKLNEFSSNYPMNEGKFAITYNPIYIIARKK